MRRYSPLPCYIPLPRCTPLPCYPSLTTRHPLTVPHTSYYAILTMTIGAWAAQARCRATPPYRATPPLYQVRGPDEGGAEARGERQYSSLRGKLLAKGQV